MLLLGLIPRLHLVGILLPGICTELDLGMGLRLVGTRNELEWDSTGVGITCLLCA